MAPIIDDSVLKDPVDKRLETSLKAIFALVGSAMQPTSVPPTDCQDIVI